jgi:hypothetical protein
MCWLRRAGLGRVVVVAVCKKLRLALEHVQSDLKCDEM